jgi:hypothetical protein
MKIKAQVELDISSEERKRIAIEYLESLLPYEHSLFKREGNYHWFENLRDHHGTLFHYNEKRPASSFEVNLNKVLQDLKK